MALLTSYPNQFLTDHTAIREWMDKYFTFTQDFTISADGRVSTAGDVEVTRDPFRRSLIRSLQVEFADVGGNFDCSNCEKLASLEGSPTTVGGNFNCSGCTELVTLRGAPQTVAGGFSCGSCASLTTLVGGPVAVQCSFMCTLCPNLLTLDGCSAFIGGSLFYNRGIGNHDIKSLTGIQTVTSHVHFTQVRKPDAVAVRNLLKSRVKLITEQKAKWISIVNDYHENGDLLTAISQFEKYFKVPFSPQMVDSVAIPELPSL